MSSDIDPADRAILSLLQTNARMSGRRIDLATFAVHQRILKAGRAGHYRRLRVSSRPARRWLRLGSVRLTMIYRQIMSTGDEYTVTLISSRRIVLFRLITV
jgi:DNA-binding Lrp family transcriptional regulator